MAKSLCISLIVCYFYSCVTGLYNPPAVEQGTSKYKVFLNQLMEGVRVGTSMKYIRKMHSVVLNIFLGFIFQMAVIGDVISLGLAITDFLPTILVSVVGYFTEIEALLILCINLCI